MPCELKRWRPGGASPVTSRAIFKETTGSMRKKWEQAPAAKGASPKQVGSREGEVKTSSARPKRVSSKPSKVKRAPYLNPDAFYRFIGPKNLGKALIDDELTSWTMELSSISSLLPMPKSEEWTSCPWTICRKRSGDPSCSSEA